MASVRNIDWGRGGVAKINPLEVTPPLNWNQPPKGTPYTQADLEVQDLGDLDEFGNLIQQDDNTESMYDNIHDQENTPPGTESQMPGFFSRAKQGVGDFFSNMLGGGPPKGTTVETLDMPTDYQEQANQRAFGYDPYTEGSRIKVDLEAEKRKQFLDLSKNFKWDDPAQVKAMQEQLWAAGKHLGTSGDLGIGIDSVYGNKTRDAHRALLNEYQELEGITPTRWGTQDNKIQSIQDEYNTGAENWESGQSGRFI